MPSRLSETDLRCFMNVTRGVNLFWGYAKEYFVILKCPPFAMAVLFCITLCTMYNDCV